MACPHTDDLADRPAQVLNDAVHRVLGPDAGIAGPYLIAALDAAGYDIVARDSRSATCPTCGSDDPESIVSGSGCDPFAPYGHPDPWHEGGR